jgi:tetratricopeptide (TPR) repeat protein
MLLPSQSSFGSDSFPEDKRMAVELYNQSRTQLLNGEYTEALEKLKRAADLYPSLALVHCNYGLVLLKLGRAVEASVELEKATSLDPNYSPSWLNLGIAYQTQGNLTAARRCFEEHLKLTPDSADAARVRAVIELGENAPGAGVGGDDYFYFVTQKNKLRWGPGRMPVKIYIADGDQVPGFKQNYGQLLRQAIDDWANASDGKIAFTFMPTEQDADMIVKWSNDISKVISPAEGGDARYRGDGAGMKHVDITLLTIDPSPTDRLSDAVVSWVCHHEIGHGLGLIGHSPDPKDIMYFCASISAALPQLTPRDKNTLVKLYTADLGPSWLALNDEAIGLVNSGNYEAGIQKYEQAINLAPDQITPKKNLIRAEGSFAIALIKSGKGFDAEEHFKRGLALEDQVHDEVLKQLVGNYAKYLRLLNRPAEADSLERKYLSP